MLSRTAIHAVRALSQLGSLPAGTYAGAGELAESIDAPRNYLGKLLQNLATVGLVESRKGTGGGFRLARAPESISLYDVVEPIDRVSSWRGCFLGHATCSDDQPCCVHSRWGALRDQYLAFLSDTTIAELDNDQPRPIDLT